MYGALGPALIVYYGVFFVAGGLIFRAGGENTRSVTQRKRMRVRLAALLMAIPATVDFLPTMHVGVYPFGYIFILGYVALSTYSIWRYRLIDITPALAARQVTETMNEGLIVVDRDGYVRVANEAAARIWGLRRIIVGTRCEDLDSELGTDALTRLIDPERESQLETTFIAKDGARRTAIISTSRLLDHRREWVGTVYIIHDITARWQAEAALRESEERFRSLVQNASDLITVIDPDTTIRYQSPAIQRVLGFDPETAIGQRLTDFVHPDDRARFFGSLSELMSEPGRVVTGVGRVQDREGEWRHLEFTGTDQRGHRFIGGLVLNVRDVTERMRLEEQLRHQALHDPLTQLGNRTRFADRLEHALLRGARSQERVAVLFMDLDNFKAVNDSLGHSAGDALLLQAAARIKRCVRPSDTVARLGGDEFAILLEGVHSDAEATAAAERIFEAFQQPFDLDGKEVVVRASIGIAGNGEERGQDAEALLREADTAMYVAKAQGKACYRVFEPAMQESMIERLELLADLPRALERDELVLHYQPIVLLRSGELFGVEALVRWQHPRRGLVPPNDFIPLAEESGAILRIGSWVLHEACRQAAAWQARFGDGDGWTISVNVSVHQLRHASFTAEVAEVLRSTGLPPSRLILEITEGVMMPNAPSTLERLRELKAIGVGLAIDDFGTGYSSLTYLKQLPLAQLKIDQGFVRDILTDSNDAAIAKMIIALSESMGLTVIAEGVENEAQKNLLANEGCYAYQGYLFSCPLPMDKFDELISLRG